MHGFNHYSRKKSFLSNKHVRTKKVQYPHVENVEAIFMKWINVRISMQAIVWYDSDDDPASYDDSALVLLDVTILLSNKQ